MSSNANLNPFLQSDGPVNIATLFATDGATPSKRPLKVHLKYLYHALFDFSDSTVIEIHQMGISYCYRINEISDICIPFILSPHLTIRASATGQGISIKKICAEQAAACETIFATQRPPTDQGRFVIAFTLMAGTSERDTPLLQADNVYLSLTDISFTN